MFSNMLHGWHISCLTTDPQRPFPVHTRHESGKRGARGRGGQHGPPADGRPPLWRRLRRRAWWLALRVTAIVGAALPPRVGRAAGAALARAGLRWRPRERAVAQANLALAFPELDAAGRERLLQRAADAAGRNLRDALCAARLAATAGAVRDERGPDGRTLGELVAAEAAAGRGVLVLSGHIGCWELFGAWLARELAHRGLPPLHVVTGVVRNPAVDRWLAGRRRAAGLVPVARTAGAAPLLRCLRGGGVLAALVDQNTAVDSRLVPFFGWAAPTPAGPARLAVRLGTPVVVATMAREGDGAHVVRHGAVWRADAGAGAEEQVDACLLEVNRQLEAAIRRNPAEWVWYHRRWDGPDDAARTGAAATKRTGFDRA